MTIFKNPEVVSSYTMQLTLNRDELELIAHVIHNYELTFADRRVENHALGTRINAAIEDLNTEEYLNSLPSVEEDYMDDN